MLGNLEFRTETYHNVLVRKNLIITIQLCQRSEERRVGKEC